MIKVYNSIHILICTVNALVAFLPVLFGEIGSHVINKAIRDIVTISKLLSIDTLAGVAIISPSINNIGDRISKTTIPIFYHLFNKF